MGQLCMVCYRQLQFAGLPEEQKRLALLSVVPERYIDAEVTDLPSEIQKGMMQDNDIGIFLWGTAGVGKTYAMAALAKKFIREGYSVKRTHYEKLCLQIRDTFNPKATETEWTTIESLLNCDKLFIEDVGTTKSIGKQETDFSLRTFLLLLDIRLEQCKPTFITSNKTTENVGASFDERIGDRLRTFLIFKLSGKSKRATK